MASLHDACCVHHGSRATHRGGFMSQPTIELAHVLSTHAITKRMECTRMPMVRLRSVVETQTHSCSFSRS